MSDRALVTGAYGLLGFWLVRALLERGDEVVVVRRSPAKPSALVLEGLERECAVVDGDVLEPGLVEGALREHRVGSVFHLAAQSIVGIAHVSPVPTFETNVRGAWTVLEACRVAGVARTVVASSDKVYGGTDVLPYTEGNALAARYPYDVSKACTDLIARSYWHTYGLPVAVTRLANTYGGGDLNTSRLVPEAVAAVLSGRAPVLRSDGSPKRDFIYVEDAVAATLHVADALADEGGTARGEAFNGGHEPHSVLDVVEAICRIAGVPFAPDIRGDGTPHGEFADEWMDSSRLRELTGWAPAVGLEEGLRRTVDWYRAHPEALAG